MIAAGQSIEACRFGSPTQPLRVVLLHEGLGSLAAWRDFPARLARLIDEPVLVYSRPGYGASSSPSPRSGGFMHHEAQVILPAVLQAFEIRRPVLIGHSDGASIALIHAGSFGENASKQGHAGPPAGVAVMAAHLFVEDITVAAIRKLSDDFKSSGLATRLARYHRDAAATFRSWADVWLSDEFRAWSIEPEVAAITCPLLAIQGEADQYGTARQLHRIAELCPRSKALMLPDCRHSPHLDQPEISLAALTGFIAGLS